jgi:uncharacterized protein (DUF924 family)
MADDLESGDAQVHEQARAVLDFWFALPPDKHFAKDSALDRAIAARFGGFVEHLIASDAAGCWQEPDVLLGAVIAVDQFTRNIGRGTADAFAGDELARSLTLYAIGKGWDEVYPAERRAFLYLPLMHAEDWGLQLLSVGKYEQLGLADNLAFARAHCDAIGQFGRFPGRNAALGRMTTPEEARWLQENDGGW